jgi:hypothetical protein
MRISAAGNVGIGTTNPQELFHVNTGASGGQVLRMSTNGADTGYLYQNTAAVILGTYSTRFLGFETNGTERARIDSSGRLLVGTSSNSGGALFQVNDDRIRVGTAKTPASASATGTAGEIAWDANYIYVCTATNTWKRTAITTW